MPFGSYEFEGIHKALGPKDYQRWYQYHDRVYWRKKAQDALGGRCCRCGFRDRRALQFDHKYGDGWTTKHTRKSSKVYYKYILSNLDRFQLLCANCNWIKRAEKGECSQSLKPWEKILAGKTFPPKLKGKIARATTGKMRRTYRGKILAAKGAAKGAGR